MSRKILLWDFDGMLGYRPGMWSKVLVDVLVEQQPTCTITIEDIRPFLRDSFPWHIPHLPHLHLTITQAWWAEVEQILAHAYKGVGYSALDAEQFAFLAHHKYIDAREWFLYADVIPTLTMLMQEWEHVILSNHVPELPAIVDALGLNTYIQTTFSSASLGYEKPHPQAFELALASLGHPSTVWMIGDNVEADILGAEARGIPAILVRKQDARAKYSCSTLLDVPSFLL